MFCITVFSDTIIIFSAVEYILKHVPHGQVKKRFRDAWWRRSITSLNRPIERITWSDDAIGKQVCRTHPQCSNQIGRYAIVMPPNGKILSCFSKKKKDRDPTISAVTNIHTQFFIQIREYPSTRILAAALSVIMSITFQNCYTAVRVIRLVNRDRKACSDR